MLSLSASHLDQDLLITSWLWNTSWRNLNTTSFYPISEELRAWFVGILYGWYKHSRLGVWVGDATGKRKNCSKLKLKRYLLVLSLWFENWSILEQFVFEVCNKNKKIAFTGWLQGQGKQWSLLPNRRWAHWVSGCCLKRHNWCFRTILSFICQTT